MPRLTEARRRDRRDQIAAAAFRCFARAGFAGTGQIMKAAVNVDVECVGARCE